MQWTFLQSFSSANQSEAEPGFTWAPTLKIVAAARDCLNSEMEKFHRWLEAQDAALKDYGGDPIRHDWNSFRPLRLSREEDWSDWLAFLLAKSKTGFFAGTLLRGEKSADFGSPEVKREVIFSMEDYLLRADLIIKWSSGSISSLEVKIGDPHLEKTLATATAIDSSLKSKGNRTDHWILLPEYQLEDWQKLVETNPANGKIEPITWESVSGALRESLLSSSEDLTWKALAYAFAGTIEQKILNLPRVNLHGDGPQTISSMQQLTALMARLARKNKL